MQVEAGYRRGYDLSVAIEHRIVDQREKQVRHYGPGHSEGGFAALRRFKVYLIE